MNEKSWRDVALKWSLCACAFVVGLLLLFLSTIPSKPDLPDWSSPTGQLGLTLCITAVLYLVFQQVFDKANHDQVEKVVSEAVGSVDEKIERVEASLDKLFTHNRILRGAFESKLVSIYETRSDGLSDLLEDMKGSKTIQVMGISLREYFMTAGHYNSDMDEIIDTIARTDGRILQALILNPNSDQATIRAERESDNPFDLGNRYEKSGLYTDVDQSMRYLQKRHINNKIEGRVYNSAPSCFLVITDTYLYIEQYHYGLKKSGLKGGHFPMLKFPTDSPVSRQLKGHFEYVWNGHSSPLTDLLDKHQLGVSKNAWECRLQNVFPTRVKAEDRIAYILENTTGDVRLLGISLRDFFLGGRRFYRILEDLYMNRKNVAPNMHVKALLLNPESEQGRLRSEREEPGVIPGNLMNEVMTSVNTIKRLRQSNAPVEAKLYSGAPSCFLILTQHSVLVEQYHYGSDEPGATILGGKVPILEYAIESPTYVELSGHFDFLWGERGNSRPVDEWTPGENIDGH